MNKRKVNVSPTTTPEPGVLVTPPAPGSLSNNQTSASATDIAAPRKRRQRIPKKFKIVQQFIAETRMTEPRAGLRHDHKDGSSYIEPAWLIYTTPEGTHAYMANSGAIIYTSQRLQFMQWMRIGPSEWVLMSQDLAKAS